MTVAENSTTMDNSAPRTVSAGQSRAWHHHPDLPIPTSPVFAWPPRPLAAVKWLASYWLAVSTIVFECVAAVAVYHLLLPDWSVMRDLAAGWIAQIYLRNLALILLVAGGLHLYFYVLGKQGQHLKFEGRGMARDNATYLFRDQVKDNMFWTIASGVTVWTAYEAIYLWCAANGWVPRITLADNPVWFIALFVLIPIWSSMHFYWVHRWLHWPPLYRLAHALHHRNVNTGPWTGISMHPVEHLLYFSSVAIHFIVPSHPIHFLFHFYYESLGPAGSHSGFEGLSLGGRKRVKLGDFFHQLHHRYFECNYGTSEMPWDRWFGSFHDGTKEATKRTRQRQTARNRRTDGRQTAGIG